MSASSDLFHLIKSLTKHEKRYFRLFATTHTRTKTSVPLKLFETLDKMEQYDEVLLQQQIQNEAFAGHLSKAKNQLATLLLNSLVAYNAGKTVNSELRETLAQIEILFNKGLYMHCRKLVKRAKKRAQQFEKYIALQEIQDWERKLLLKRAPNDLRENFADHHQEREKVIGNIEDLNRQLFHLDSVVSVSVQRQQQLHNLQDRKILEQIIRDPQQFETMQTRSNRAAITHLRTCGLYYWMAGSTEVALEYYRRMIERWEKYPLFKRDNRDEYKRDLTNYLTFCIALRQHDAFWRSLQQIKSIPSESVDTEIEVFQSISYLELAYYLNNGRLDDALREAPNVEKGIKKYREKMQPHRLITLHYNCGILYFLAAEYEKALRHLNAIINQTHTRIKRDTREFAQVLSLVIHFELKHYKLVEYLYRSSYRYLVKNDALRPMEKVVLHAIQKLLNSPDASSARIVLRKLYRELLTLLHSSDVSEPHGLLELLFWAESKTLGRTITDLYTEKAHGGEMDARKMFPRVPNKTQI